MTLPEVDEVGVTTMVDNTFDALLASAEGVTRASPGAGPTAARQFAGGEALARLRAEHGFSALVTVHSGNVSSTLLFDSGASPDGLAVNAERLGIDAGACRASCSATDTSTTPAASTAWPGCAGAPACR
ncbi:MULTISPECIES: hypothetical protein [Streptomyces]|uniref:hypothetical protein n=1 Tax=Streptomyces TaxID=1883 RepID=UPI00068E07B7|nr:hypothetical protein [Streptomyces durhamensis]